MAIPEVLSADVVLLGPGLLMSSEEMESFRESVQTEVVSTAAVLWLALCRILLSPVMF